MRRAAAILSLVLLVLPLPIGFAAAYRIINRRESYESSNLSIAARISDDLSKYTGMLFVGMFGFVLAGICLDGVKERGRWYFYCLAITGVGWLVYLPIGSVFGVCLLAYLFVKRREFKNSEG